MRKKSSTTIGLEYSPYYVRAARTTSYKTGMELELSLEDMEEITGDFSNDKNLVQALKNIRQKISISHHEDFVTCVFGKQVYAAQLPYRDLPEKEMKDALRFEIKKNLPFDINTTNIEYQVVGKDPKKRHIVVTAVAKALLNKHLVTLRSAGIKPQIVDVLPIAAANAYWISKKQTQKGVPGAVIHISPGICTFVADGSACPFFHRNIYFSAQELFKYEKGKTLNEVEKMRRLDTLAGEIVRSLSFYKQTYRVSGFAGLFLMGEYAQLPDLVRIVEEKTGMHVTPIDLANEYGVKKENTETGKFDLAIALSERTDVIV